MKGSRRRFLQITSFATAAAAGGGWARPLEAVEDAGNGAGGWHWQGILFGTEASIRLHGVDPERGRHLTENCFQRMRALEKLFSLYDPESALSRLNRDGFLPEPDPEFLALMRQAVAYGRSTGGVFDVTVQPLWRLYKGHYEIPGVTGPPAEKEVARALIKVGYEVIKLSESEVRLPFSEMAVTLNGIAQGYITDRVAEYLRAEGMEKTLLHLGEYRALGQHPEGRPWEIGVRSADDFAEVADSLPLQDAALAMSGGYGFTFDPEGQYHHLFHPETGEQRPANETVCVTAPNATLADALSTACAVVEPERARALAEGHGVGLRIVKG